MKISIEAYSEIEKLCEPVPELFGVLIKGIHARTEMGDCQRCVLLVGAEELGFCYALKFTKGKDDIWDLETIHNCMNCDGDCDLIQF